MRIDPFRILAATLLLAALASPVLAATPTASEIDEVQATLGIDLVTSITMDRIDHIQPLARTPSTKRACFKEQVGAFIAKEMDERAVAAFGTSERVGELLAWSRSQAGAKFVAFVRAGVPAMMDGAPLDLATFKATVTEAELLDTARFLNTPPGLALREYVSLPGEFLPDAKFFAAFRTCGIDPKTGR